ncbi:hypothetical protein Tco_0367867 [Tanacetum coccineum]
MLILKKGVEIFDKRGTHSLLNAACKKYLNLLKKGLLVQGKLRQLPSGEYRDGLQILTLDQNDCTCHMIPPEPEGLPRDNHMVLQNIRDECDTKVLTMKMEILLEPTSNKLLVVGFNLPVHSPRALSTLRHSGLRTASTAVKPCLEDSSEFYLITGRIPDEKYEHAGPKVTTLHGGNTTTRMIKRFTVADDLKESSKITQVKGTKFKDHYIMYKEINA